MTAPAGGAIELEPTEIWRFESLESSELERRDSWRVIASSPRRAADGVKVSPEAWTLERFRSNPLLLWNHERSALPIGQVPKIGIARDRLEAEITFAAEDVNPFGYRVGRAWAAGLVRSVSVYARVLEAPKPTFDSDGRLVALEARPGSIELAELSVVNIGSDPEAMAIARSWQFTDSELERFNRSPAPDARGLATVHRRRARLAEIEATRPIPLEEREP